MFIKFFNANGTLEMADNLTVIQRRGTLAKIRSKSTAPELIVRHLIHELGYRYTTFTADELPAVPKEARQPPKALADTPMDKVEGFNQ